MLQEPKSVEVKARRTIDPVHQARANVLAQHSHDLECYILGATFKFWREESKDQSLESFYELCKSVKETTVDYLVTLERLKNPNSIQAKIATASLKQFNVHLGFPSTEENVADIAQPAIPEMYKKIPNSNELVYDCPCCGRSAHLFQFSKSQKSPTSYVVCCSDSEDSDPETMQPMPCVLSLPPDNFYRPTKREAISLWNSYFAYCKSSK